MTYLLDTNVLSETRKRQPAVSVADWIAATPPGPAARLRADPGRARAGNRENPRPRGLAAGSRPRALAPGCGGWVRGPGFPVTLPVATAWGHQQYAQPLPAIDALIAATARVHGLTVITRNVKDFEPAGIPVLNPFAE